MVSTFFLFLLLALLAIIPIAVVIFEFYMVIFSPWKGAPFVPSKKENISAMITLARVAPGERVLDLGSGNGAIVFAAARAGAHATGVEINPLLVWYARFRARRNHLDGRTTFVRADLKSYPLADADIIFLYLLPKTMAAISDKLTREAKPGTRIISNRFSLPGWTPKETSGKILVYQR